MPLPKILIDRYKDWKTNSFETVKSNYEKIEINKQNPIAMVISCCDSRIQENVIFKTNPGDLFIHKNIANLIPPFNILDQNHNIGSSIEYAVKDLNVPHIIILGHSSCGGIKSAYDIMKNNYKSSDFNSLNNWLKIVKTPFENLSLDFDVVENLRLLEKESIKNSIKNLLEYPFVNDLVTKNKIEIHGLWYEIKQGNLMYLNQSSGKFENL
tara:strand:+ start:44 stop:676 length:633 start_codon:yes stop_codon:yes gene_type:complete